MNQLKPKGMCHQLIEEKQKSVTTVTLLASSSRVNLLTNFLIAPVPERHHPESTPLPQL
jgi:hypothetical protein